MAFGQPSSQPRQYTPPGSNPLPEWKYWQPSDTSKGGWGYADPGVLPAAGPNTPAGYQNTMTEQDVQALQQPQSPAAPPPGAPPPSGGGTTSRPKPAAQAPTLQAPRTQQTLEDKMRIPAPGPGWVRLATGDWVPPDHPAIKSVGVMQGQPGSQGAAAPGAGGLGQAVSQAQLDQVARNRILGLLESDLTPDPNELRASPEMAARSLMNQRAYERNRAILAERAAASGTDMSGGMDSGILRLAQARGEDDTAFIGELASRRIDAAREDIKQGIEFARAMGDAEKERELQMKLAQLDAAVKREQIKSSASQSKSDIALRRELGLGQLGYNYDALQANLNSQAGLAMLGGGF